MLQKEIVIGKEIISANGVGRGYFVEGILIVIDSSIEITYITRSNRIDSELEYHISGWSEEHCSEGAVRPIVPKANIKRRGAPSVDG